MGNANYKKRHKELGLCLNCSRKAVIGLFCVEHYYNRLRYNKLYNNARRGERSKYKKERRDLLKSQGRCPDCGIELMEEENICCVNCMVKKGDRV